MANYKFNLASDYEYLRKTTEFNGMQIPNKNIIQMNNNKLTNYLNSVVNKAATFLGQRKPEVFLQKVNMWLEKENAAQKPRILKALPMIRNLKC